MNIKSYFLKKYVKQITLTQPETGRSMVEMLGVLAVIGVLSIGGIAGYSYAMKKYQTNKVIYELNLLSNQIALTLEQPHEDDFELSLGDYDTSEKLVSADYAFAYGCGDASTDDDFCYIDDTAYFMEISNFPKDICQSLASITQHISYFTKQIINKNEDKTGARCSDQNTLLLLFDTNPNKSTPPPFSNPVTTTSTTPVLEDKTDGTFIGSLDWNNQSLKEYSCSFSEFVYVNSQNECNKCDNTDYKRVFSYPQRCHRCDNDFISDKKDDIRSTCKKCGRGVNWTNPKYYLQEGFYMCAPDENDIGSENDIITTKSTTTTTPTTTTTTPSTTTTTKPSVTITSTTPVLEDNTNGTFIGYLDWTNQSLKEYSCSFSEFVYVNSQNECNKCDNTDYKRVFSYPQRCHRCDNDFISDKKDDIRSTCKKCGRGVNWTNPKYYLQEGFYMCAPDENDIGSENDIITTKSTTTTTPTTTTTTPTTTTTTPSTTTTR